MRVMVLEVEVGVALHRNIHVQIRALGGGHIHLQDRGHFLE
jgi:hypothetical protein